MDDTRTSPNPEKTRKPITCLELNYTHLPPRAGYFVVSVWRGDWNTPDSRVRFFYRPSRASLLRVNRAQRLLIRRVTGHGGYVTDLPAVTIEPETNTELGQLVTNEIEAAGWPGVPMCADPECLNAADLTSRGGYCLQHAAAHWTAEETLRREG